MQTTAIQSAPAPNEQAAIAAVNGLIGDVGRGRRVKIVNLDVREVDGLWVAIAFLEILDDEPQDKPEDEREKEHHQTGAGSGANSEQERDFGVDIYYLRGHISEAGRAMADAAEGVVPGNEPVPYVQEMAEADAQARRREMYEEEQWESEFAVGNVGASSSEDLSSMVQNDFNQAETAVEAVPVVTPSEAMTSYAVLTEEERRRVLERDGMIIIPDKDGEERPEPALS